MTNHSREPNEIPPSWVWVGVGDVITRMASGISRRQSRDKGEFPVSRIETISNETIEMSKVGYLDDIPPDIVEKYRLQPRDILFSNINSDTHLGKTAIFLDDNIFLLHGMNLLLLRPNQRRLKQVSIPLAPMNEQIQIISKIEELFTQLDAGVATLKRAQANLIRFKASVLKAACEGKLVPTEAELPRAESQDFEPASILLKRNLATRKRNWEEKEWGKLVDKVKKKAAKAARKDAGRPLKRGEKLAPEEWKNLLEAEYSKYLPKDDKWKHKYKEPEPPDTEGLPELPEGWVWATLPQLGELNRGKSKHRPRNDPKLYGGPYPFIQTGDIRHAEGTITNYTQTYSEDGLAQSRLWPRGTLVITIAANIAETAILGFDSCFPDSVVGFLTENNNCDACFIEFFFRTAKDEIERYAPATAQKNINLQVLSKLAIPLPPLNEQKRICQILEQSISIIQVLENEISENVFRVSSLRQSILKQAFEGKLVAQEPRDEPANYFSSG